MDTAGAVTAANWLPGPITASQVDAAARVLWAMEQHEEWDRVSDDDREPYRHIARQMLEAAAAA